MEAIDPADAKKLDRECKKHWENQLAIVDHWLCKGTAGVKHLPFEFEHLVNDEPEVELCPKSCCLLVRYCFKYLKGNCANGDDCMFPHVSQEVVNEMKRAKGKAQAKAKAKAKATPKGKARPTGGLAVSASE